MYIERVKGPPDDYNMPDPIEYHAMLRRHERGEYDEMPGILFGSNGVYRALRVGDVRPFDPDNDTLYLDYYGPDWWENCGRDFADHFFGGKGILSNEDRWMEIVFRWFRKMETN